jgi:hypothetical protein
MPHERAPDPDPHIELVPYREELRDTWERLVRSASNGHFFMERGFLDYHGNRFEDASFLVRRRGHWLGVIPMHRVDRNAWHSHDGIPFAGLIANPRLNHSDEVSLFAALREQLRRQEVRALKWTPVPWSYRRQPGDGETLALENLGATKGRSKSACMLRLDQPAHRTKRLITQSRSALTRELQFVEQVPLEVGWELVADTLARRHDAPPLHRPEDWRYLAQRYPDQIHGCGIQSPGGELLVFQLLFLCRPVVRMQAVGYTPDAVRFHAVEKLCFELATRPWTRYQWLDFGTSNDPATGELVESLHEFKERFGGRTVLIPSYEWRAEVPHP